MRIGYSLSSVAIALACALGPRLARADIAPPPGYVEQCTLAKQSKPQDECHACSAFYGNAAHCSESLKSYGFTQRCRTGGASVWSEIWCRKKDSSPAVPASILEQLGNASAHPATTGAAPTDPSVPSASAVPAAPSALSAEPAAPTAAPPAPTQLEATPPSPPPQRPSTGCGGCVTTHRSDSAAGPLALVALAGLACRRRRDPNS